MSVKFSGINVFFSSDVNELNLYIYFFTYFTYVEVQSLWKRTNKQTKPTTVNQKNHTNRLAYCSLSLGDGAWSGWVGGGGHAWLLHGR